MKRPEELIHKAIVRFLGHALPVDAVCWHTPNQRGTRAKWEAALLKGLGVLPGNPERDAGAAAQCRCVDCNRAQR